MVWVIFVDAELCDVFPELVQTRTPQSGVSRGPVGSGQWVKHHVSIAGELLPLTAKGARSQ